PIHSSNVMLYSTKQKVASRVAYTINDDGRKVRMLKKTGEVLEN
ncbi:MAG: 50S ribosomal protein L24, partial [Cyanobacteria bacterium J06623_5]